MNLIKIRTLHIPLIQAIGQTLILWLGFCSLSNLRRTFSPYMFHRRRSSALYHLLRCGILYIAHKHHQIFHDISIHNLNGAPRDSPFFRKFHTCSQLTGRQTSVFAANLLRRYIYHIPLVGYGGQDRGCF